MMLAIGEKRPNVAPNERYEKKIFFEIFLPVGVLVLKLATSTNDDSALTVLLLHSLIFFFPRLLCRP
jgi:hypothetical protein